MKKIVVYFIMMFCLGVLFVSAGSVQLAENESTDLYQDAQKVEIQLDELPAAVSKTLASDEYASMEIDKVYKVSESKLAVTYSTYYLVEFTGSEGEIVSVKFDEEGNVIE